MIPTLILISIISFVALQLPPGDYLSTYAATLSASGEYIDEESLDALRDRYGLGQPLYVQYGKWIYGIVTRGDWGQSMEWQMPVKDLVGEALGLTVALAVFSLLISWLIAIPMGVYSATHQYSMPDYVMSSVSFLGVGVPAFLWALIIMYWQTELHLNVGGCSRNSISARRGAGWWTWAHI
jgi:peptide/nickel transport system permease protein